MFKFEFNAIGTRWEIDTSRPLAPSLRQAILKRIEDFDTAYSRFRPDSLVARIAAAADGGSFRFPEDAPALFELYDRLHAATSGAVDPLIGRDLELLGYDRHYSLTHDPIAIERHSHARPSWEVDIQRQGSVVVTERSVVIDVGAAGKGYLVDIVAEMLRNEGIHAFVVDGSGDLIHAGSEPLDIGLEHPSDPTLAIGVARLKRRALCASASNRRAWGPFHHVVDGRTGVPVHDVIATWVVADDALTADGLATALFFTPAGDLAASFEFSCVRMFADGRAEISPNFDGELFT
ncbi:FAD:protein FMN transferase [Bradyrhizobium cenepequi]